MIETSGQNGRQEAHSRDVSGPDVNRSAIAGRALVVIDAGAKSRPDERPSAPFVTQLIACARRLPAFRTARRAAPEMGARTYRLIDKASQTPTDRLSIVI